MKATVTSARFAAFVWYCEVCADPKAAASVNQSRARRFAAKHWRSFLPWAHQGLGRLLLKVAGPRRRGGSRHLSLKAS